MAEHSSPDTLTAKVLDYIGMGFLSAPPEVLILEVAVSAAPVNWTLVIATFLSCYVVGVLTLGLGLKWEKIKPKLSKQLADSITRGANSPWLWFSVLVFLAFGPPVLVGIFSSRPPAVSIGDHPASSQSSQGPCEFMFSYKQPYIEPASYRAAYNLPGTRFSIGLKSSIHLSSANPKILSVEKFINGAWEPLIFSNAEDSLMWDDLERMYQPKEISEDNEQQIILFHYYQDKLIVSNEREAAEFARYKDLKPGAYQLHLRVNDAGGRADKCRETVYVEWYGDPETMRIELDK